MTYEIIKTQGTKTSFGSFMIYDNDTDEYLFDVDGNNAWDFYQEADSVLKKFKDDGKLRLRSM